MRIAKAGRNQVICTPSADIPRVDLIERAVAPTGKAASPHQPVVGRRPAKRRVSYRLERLQNVIAGSAALPAGK
jgi:hypothetical protein